MRGEPRSFASAQDEKPGVLRLNICDHTNIKHNSLIHEPCSDQIRPDSVLSKQHQLQICQQVDEEGWEHRTRTVIEGSSNSHWHTNGRPSAIRVASTRSRFVARKLLPGTPSDPLTLSTDIWPDMRSTPPQLHLVSSLQKSERESPRHSCGG